MMPGSFLLHSLCSFWIDHFESLSLFTTLTKNTEFCYITCIIIVTLLANHSKSPMTLRACWLFQAPHLLHWKSLRKWYRLIVNWQSHCHILFSWYEFMRFIIILRTFSCHWEPNTLLNCMNQGSGLNLFPPSKSWYFVIGIYNATARIVIPSVLALRPDLPFLPAILNTHLKIRIRSIYIILITSDNNNNNTTHFILWASVNS